MRRNLLIAIVAVTVTFGLPVLAAADSITVSYNLGYMIKASISGTSRSLYTAEMLVSWGTWDQVYGYCVDPMESAGSGSSYDVYTPSEASTYAAQIFSDEGGLAAAFLLSNFSTSLQGLGTTSLLDRTALQVAIWEAIYDYDSSDPSGSLDLSSGTFVFQGSSSKTGSYRYSYNITAQVLARATEMLSLLASYEFTAEQIATLDKYFRVAVKTGQQDLVFGMAGGGDGGTPEPGTMLLLGSAMALGGYWRRRKVRSVQGAAH